MDKNLKLRYAERLFVPDEITNKNNANSISKSIFKEVRHVCVEPVNPSLYLATQNEIVQLDPRKREKTQMDWADKLNGNEVIMFEYLYDDATTFTLLSNGTAIVNNFMKLMNSYEMDTVEIINEEVTGGSWSPDTHILVVTTREKVYFVSREFDIISEGPLNPTTAGQSELMSVGWGSRETQFQGPSGRKKLDESETNEELKLSEFDSHKVMFTWSQDSQFVVISFVDEENLVRRTCLWNDEGDLISRLQTVSCLYQAITYRSSQNVVVMSAIGRDQHRKLIFFERNGQILSEFDLRKIEDTSGDVVWMSWNSSSDILAIRVHSTQRNSDEIEWWSLNNNKFSLKYRFKFETGIVTLWWDKSEWNCFYYLTKSGNFMALYFEFVYTIHDMTVFTIRGKEVCLTHLNKNVSPLGNVTVELPETICEICVCGKKVLFYLTGGLFALYEFVDDGKLTQQEVFSGNDVGYLSPHSEVPVFCLTYDGENHFSALSAYPEYRLISVEMTSNGLKSKDVCEASQALCYQIPTSANGILIEAISGEWIHVKDIEEFGDEMVHFIDFERLYNTKIFDCQYNKQLDVLVGISTDKRLVINDRVVSNMVESFSLGDMFVVYLTWGETLHSCEMNTLNLLTNNHKKVCVDGRYIECGARVIGHDEVSGKVWLSMPRGNIEERNSRALLLHRFNKMIDERKYGEVINEMNRNRVDFNFIVDYKPKAFLENIEMFMKSVNDSDLLSLFVLSLNEKDTTTSVYGNFYDRNEEYSASEFYSHSNKVNTVCTRIREYLLGMGDEELLVNSLYGVLVTTYLKMDPPQIGEALCDISERSAKQEDGKGFERKWIEYIAMIMPRANLMRAALSFYNIPLAVISAQYSQQDPMEYLAILNELRAYHPESYQHYRIDLYLERYSNALENIVECDERIDEAIALIKKHQLFSKALLVYRGRKHYSRICKEVGMHLFRKRLYEEAILMFHKSDDLKMIIECIETGFLWRDVPDLELNNRITSKECEKILTKLHNHAENIANYSALADISLMTAQSASGLFSNPSEEMKETYEKMTQMYCMASDWKRALLCAHHQPERLKCVEELGVKRFDELMEHIKTWKKQFLEYSKRLEVLRVEKRKNILNCAMNVEDHFENTQSEMSTDTSSTMSGYSRASVSTTVRREKRIQKKKLTLTKGSAYEDAGLLNALKNIVSVVDKHQEEVKGLIRALFVVDKIEESNELQLEFASLISSVDRNMTTIWPSYLEAHIITGPIREMYRDVNGCVLLPTDNENLMPQRINLSSEMIAPLIRKNVFWKMQIWDENK